MFADVVDGADVGMVQRRSGLGLAAEALQSPGVLGEFFRQELQSNKAGEPGVLGLVYDAQLLDDAVVRDGLADQTGDSSPSREQS
jgi:hypothetical protein